MKTIEGDTINRMQLLPRVFLRYLLALVWVGAMLFLPAGSLAYWNAWLYLVALFVPMFGVMVYFIVADPELLQKRIQMREKEKPQKLYLTLSLIFFFVAFILPGFDYRYHWSSVPLWLVVVSTVLMLSGYVSFIAVMLQNRYASRVIEIQHGQRLIDTGMYSVVRHPMYLSALVLYAFSPLVLGSYYAMIPMIFLPPLLRMRILNEEEVLKKGLPGYEEYMARVRYRLIPFVW